MWTEHYDAEGRLFFYNAAKRTSAWAVPEVRMSSLMHRASRDESYSQLTPCYV